MRIPELGPVGETFFEVSDFAIVSALFVNKPGGGWVEFVLTVATHFLLPLDGRLFFFRFTIAPRNCTAELCSSSKGKEQDEKY
jgi:hypothetical protein